MNRRWLLISALSLEGALLAVAFLGGWWLGVSPLVGVQSSAAGQLVNLNAGLWGAVAAIPLCAAFLWGESTRWRPAARFRRYFRRHVAPLFDACSTTDLLLIALAAGIGEELFFRGLVQSGLADWLSPNRWATLAGLVAASLAFGVCHWLTPGYAILATAAGLYLGGLQILTGSVLAPVAAHAIYDAFVLLRLTSARGGRPRGLSAKGLDE